ncbi:MAG: hypothetical protein ACRD2Z_09640 [Thermoanaerobaculia bacterium]
MTTGLPKGAPDFISDAPARSTPTAELIPAGRDPVSGQFVAGNMASLRHGARSERLQRRIEAEAVEALASRRLAIRQDLGDQLSVIAADVVDRYVTATALLDWMERRLLEGGVLTGKGKRKAVHAAYLQQLDRVVRLASLLGLDREPREAGP